MKKYYFLICMCVTYTIFSSELESLAENKKIVGEKITIYTAEGPIPATMTQTGMIYHYEAKNEEKEDKDSQKNKKKKSLNELEKAELIFYALKDKKIKPKL